MKFLTSINSEFDIVRKSFADKDCKLMNRLLPFGCGILRFKGIRRRAKISIHTWFLKTYSFKVVMTSSSASQYYFHIINEGDLIFGIKMWTHRYKIIRKTHGVNIQETLEFTTKNKTLDIILSVFINMMFLIRKFKYKMFFLFKN